MSRTKDTRPEYARYETGHRPHMTGGGVHASTPNRQRTRGNAKRAAIREGY